MIFFFKPAGAKQPVTDINRCFARIILTSHAGTAKASPFHSDQTRNDLLFKCNLLCALLFSAAWVDKSLPRIIPFKIVYVIRYCYEGEETTTPLSVWLPEWISVQCFTISSASDRFLFISPSLCQPQTSGLTNWRSILAAMCWVAHPLDCHSPDHLLVVASKQSSWLPSNLFLWIVFGHPATPSHTAFNSVDALKRGIVCEEIRYNVKLAFVCLKHQLIIIVFNFIYLVKGNFTLQAC